MIICKVILSINLKFLPVIFHLAMNSYTDFVISISCLYFRINFNQIYFEIKKIKIRDGKMAQTALLEDLGSVSRTHMVANEPRIQRIQHPPLVSVVTTCIRCTDTHQGNIHTCKKKKNKISKFFILKIIR